MSGIRILLSTINDATRAEEIAKKLVSTRLAACVNIVPQITSIYRWKNALEIEPEVLMIIKVSSDRIEELVRRLIELHPYEVPEVIALPVESGHRPYLDWVISESGEPS